MQELSESAKRMLEALKAEETPSKASADRMWAAVAATGATATAAATLGKGKLLLLGALGVTGGVALWIFAMPSAPEPTSAFSEPVPARAEVSHAPTDPATPTPAAATGAVAPAPAPSELDRVVPSPERVAARSPAVAKKSHAKAKVPSAEGEDLERELALLAEAKAALSGGDAAGALARLDRHREDFPRSSFAPERDFLRMTALCEQGKREQARRLAAEFLARNPGSALRPRVEQVCRDE